jgi:hypothetical protein
VPSLVTLLLAAVISQTTGEALPPQLVLAERQSPPKPAAKPAAKPSPDDFDLLPKEAAPDRAALARQRELERKLAQRHTMLRFHQLAGFLTLASLTTTVVLGQLGYRDKYGGRGDVGTFRAWHRWAGIATTAIFAGTASLAVFAPVPIEKKTRLDTVTLHKIAMTVAAAGMAAQIVLGIVTAGAEGQRVQRDYALAHQIVGYTTLVAAFAGFTVLTF